MVVAEAPSPFARQFKAAIGSVLSFYDCDRLFCTHEALPGFSMSTRTSIRTTIRTSTRAKNNP